MNNSFTPIQSKMLAVLSDGLPHTRKELHACLNDELGPESNITPHLSNIRKKLKSVGQHIICERMVGNRFAYRHIRLLVPAEPT